ncbi:MAG: nucleotide exchange factor GrpE [Acidimicrobiales bacterium]
MSGTFDESSPHFADGDPEPDGDSDADDIVDTELVRTPGGGKPAPGKSGAGTPGGEDEEGAGETSEAGGAESPPNGGKPQDPFRLLDGDLTGLESLLSDDFARISAERDEFLDSLKRLQADFDNFRKRAGRQQAETRQRATEALVLRLLPVLDSLELALAHLGLGATAPTDEASIAVLQVNAQLHGILAREGLERIDAIGVGFDPTMHEATAMDDSAPPKDQDGNGDGNGEPAGPTVTEVWRSGYRMGDRVIRPAMVRVRG